MKALDGKKKVSHGKSFLLVLLFGLLPRCFCFAVFLTKHKSGWAICGSSWWCVSVGDLFVMIAYIYGPIVSLYNFVFHCLCSRKDRASERHRPYPRKKKILFRLLCVISGLLAGGSPGFRTVLCCFQPHRSWYVLCVLFCVDLCLLPYQYQRELTLPTSGHVPLLRLFCLGALFGCFPVLFLVLLWRLLCLFFLWHDYDL